MHVIPAINAKSRDEVEEKISIIRSFTNEVHFDYADRTMTTNILWGSAHAIAALRKKYQDLFFEVHIMSDKPLPIARRLHDAGIDRIIMHAEYLSPEEAQLLGCDEKKIMVSFLPETDIGSAYPLFSCVSAFQILSVHPGFAGQPFQEDSLEKVTHLREMMPDATIEVDGGIADTTIKAVACAGADTVVSASYIFNNASPKDAYEQLSSVQCKKGGA
jgi:ribulose-phosphate 3-epimerase